MSSKARGKEKEGKDSSKKIVKKENFQSKRKQKRKERKFPIKEWEKAKRRERKFPIKEWEKEKKEKRRTKEEVKSEIKGSAHKWKEGDAHAVSSTPELLDSYRERL